MLILLIIGLPCAMIIGSRERLEYAIKGIEVNATIIDVKRNGIRISSGETVTVTYKNENGILITAKAITNSKNNYIGKVIVGKVLPDEPDCVYVAPSNSLNIIAYILVTISFLAGVLILWLKARGIRISKLIKTHGTVTDAIVTKVYHYNDDHFVDLEFYDLNKNLLKSYTEDLISSRTIGDRCTIQYYAKSSKRVYSIILR